MAITIEELLNSHGFGAASVNLIKEEYEPSGSALVDGLIWYKPSTRETKMYMDGDFRLLAAHGTYFTKFTSETLVTERTKKVEVGITEYKPGLDFIQVSKNGGTITENVDYYVDKGTKEIVTMKADWVEGDKFSFEIAIITTVPYPNNNLFLQLEDHVLANEGEDVIRFNVPQYLPEYDLLRVHQRNLEIFKEIDWVLGDDRQSVKLNYKTKEAEEFHFTIIKQVRGNTNGLMLDGTMITPGSITKDALGFIVDEIDPEILDGIVTDRENRIFEQYKEDISKDKSNVDTRFSIIYENVFLKDPAKTELAMAKTEFDEAYENYKEIIDRSLLDMDIVNDERIEINRLLEVYRNELTDMVKAFEKALDNISANRFSKATDDMSTSVNAKLEGYISASLYQQDLEVIKGQLDGNITSWFYPHEPMMMNEPAISWDTADKRNVHLGDLFYDTVTGYAYRFASESGEYKWITIQDTDVQKALREASKAQDTADSKRRTFVVQPIPPYDIGDLWVQGAGGDILSSIHNKLAGDTFNPTDWIMASKYTDDARAIEAEGNARVYADELNGQVQKEISDVGVALTGLDEYVDGAFLDGVISATEHRDIKIYINVLQTQKSDVDNRFTVIIAEADLDGAYRVTLQEAKTQFDLVHADLVQTIQSSVADGVATDEERLLVDQKFDAYALKVSILSESFETAIHYIAQKKAGNAETNAKKHADALKTAIDSEVMDVNTRITNLNSYIDEAFLDSVIDLTERESIRTYLHQIDTEKSDVDVKYSSIHDDADLNPLASEKGALFLAKSQYDTAHLELKIAIMAAIDDSVIDGTERGAVNAAFTVYRTQLSVLSLRLKEATDVIILKRAQDAEDRAVERINQSLIDYVSLAAYTSDFEKIQEQVDGSITSWFYPHEPTMTNEPSMNWPTNIRNSKLGDLFYNTVTGYAYRFALEEGVYKWIKVQDTDVQKALKEASTAQDTADSKRRVFVVQPIPPYDKGDLWADGQTIFRALVAIGDGGTFSSGHWERVGDVTSNNTSADTNKVAGRAATEIADAAINFNSRNDRNPTIPGDPVVQVDLTAVDHVINSDGSADVSFEWVYEGAGESYDIDGFFVYVRNSAAAGTYLFGTNPVTEVIYPVSYDKRSFVLYGIPADHYYTFGVQAYREVDQDITPSGVLLSSIKKATAISENPYRPESSVAFTGDVKGTIDGVPASDLETKEGASDKSQRAIDEAVSYTDRLRNELMVTRTEVWIRHFLESNVFSKKNPIENVYGSARGTLFAGLNSTTLQPLKEVDTAGAVYLLAALSKSYKESNQPEQLNYLNYLANFLTTRISNGYYGGVGISVIPASFDYDEANKTYTPNLSRVPMRLIYTTAWALLGAFDLTKDVRYRDVAGDLMDTAAYLSTHIQNRIANSTLATYMEGAQYDELFSANGTDFVVDENVFSNTLSDAVFLAANAFPEDMINRTNKGGATYSIAEHALNYSGYLKRLEVDGRLGKTTGVLGLYEFMQYQWGDATGTDGRYLPVPKNLDAAGGYAIEGDIRASIQAKAIAGMAMAGEPFATKYANALLPLRVENRGNDILFFDSYNATGVPSAGAKIDLSVTAALFHARYELEIKEDETAFVQTLKNHQARSFNRGFDGAMYRNPDDKTFTDSTTLAYAATTPIEKIAVPGGLDSVFLDIQRATYGLDDKINALDNYVENAFSDGVISEMEARAIGMYLNQIDTENATMDSRYEQLIDLGIVNLTVKSSLTTAKTSYDTAYNALRNSITVSIGDRDITTEERDTVDANFSGYRETIKVLQGTMEVYVATQTTERAAGAEENAKLYTNNLLVNYVNKALYQADIEEIKKQVDGNITTWFFGHTPSLANEPTADWDTIELKNQHLGDVFYNTETGHAFRFALSDAVYGWIQIQDSDIQAALEQASKAQDTADSKRRTFVVQPIPPYDAGDLWLQDATGDILTATAPKTSGQNFSSVDWKLASKYTDDQRAINAEVNAKGYADGLKLQIDEEIGELGVSLTTLDSYLNNAFRDGVITAAEAKAIQTHIQVIDNEKADVDTRYGIVYGSTKLSAATKQSLSTLKVAYDAGHTNVVAVINATIADSKVVDAERVNIETEFAGYRQALQALSGGLESAVDEISTKKSSDAEGNAKTYADGIKVDLVADVGDVTNRLGTLDEYLAGAYKDNLVDESEAAAIRTHIEQLKNEKADVDNRYAAIHGNSFLTQILKDDLASAKTNWDASHSALITSIETSIVDPKITVSERTTIDSNFNTYRSRMATLSQKLEAAVDSIVDLRAIAAEVNAKEHADLIKIGFDSELGDLAASYSGFRTEVEGAFRDGVIEESEALSIGAYLNTLRSEKRDLDERYATLYANPDLLNPEKAALQTAKSEFDSAQSTLVATVNIAIVDGRATAEERNNVNSKFDLYSDKLGVLAVRLEEAINSVASKKSSDAVAAANVYADTMKIAINQDIDDVGGRVNTIDTYISGALQDDILTIAEKSSIRSYVEQINKESKDLDGRYVVIYNDVLLTGGAKTNLATKNGNYAMAFADLMSAIDLLVAGDSITVAERNALDAAFTAYRNALADYSSALTTAVNAIAQARAYNAEYNSKKYTDDTLGGYVSTVLFEQSIEELQLQSDGSMMTWFYNYPPTMAVAPSIEWTTTALKNMHLGDLFYDTETGYAYRFAVVDSVYKWIRIKDSDVEAALQKASKAQDTADSKRRTFVVQPTVPYDVGDLWVQGATGDIMSAKTKKIIGQAYSLADWVKAGKYTDDTRAVNAEKNAKDYADTLKVGIDSEITDVFSSVNDLDSYVKGSFADGIIETSEAKAISVYLNTLLAEKVDVDNRHSAIMANPALLDPAKANATTAKTAFDTAHSQLISTINTAIADGYATVVEKQQVDAKFDAYRIALSEVSRTIQLAIDAIGSKKADDAEAAAGELVRVLQEAVTADISDVNTRVTDFNTYVDQSFRDGIIEAAEAKAIAAHLEQISNEKTDVDNRYTTIYNDVLLGGTAKTGLKSAKDGFEAAHVALESGINAAISDGKTTTAEATSVKGLFTTYRTKIATLAIAFENAIGFIAQKKADQVKDYVQSRGENLVTNGTGLLGDNTNFSGFTFDGSQAFAGAGSFFTDAQNSVKFNDELIPIDQSKRYRLGLMALSKTGLGHNYFGMVPFDIDKHSITSPMMIAPSYPVVSLAQDLTVGDTVMHLTSLNGFIDNGGDNSHTHSLMMWGYKNSYGYEYPPGTYSRFYFGAAWLNGAINATNKTITFSKPFNLTNPNDPVGVFRAGHQLSRTTSGGSYIYNVAGNVKVPTSWTKYEGLVEGIGVGGSRTPHGSAFIKLMLLTNRSSSGGTAGDNLWINSVELVNLDAETRSIDHADAIKLQLTEEIGDIEAALGDFQSTVTTSFRDGVISEAETRSIESYIQVVTTEKSDVDSRYTAIYANANLAGTAKTELATAKTNYNTAHSGLVSTITAAIADKVATAAEKTAVDANFGTYRTALSALALKLEAALDYISTKKAATAEGNAIGQMETIQLAINQDIGDVDGRVTGLNTYLDVAFKDDVISQAEARAIGTHVEQLNTEKIDVDNRYTAIFNDASLIGAAKTNLSGAKTTYGTRHGTLLSSISTVVTAGKVTADQKATIATNFTNYRSALSVLSTRFEEATLAIGSKKAADAQAAAILNTTTTLNNYVTSTMLGSELSDLQSQIDGNITTWFYPYAPTLSNAPASSWSTAAVKNQHLADIHYDTETGYAYRFALESTTYKWIRIQDSDVEAALLEASKAQDTADSKRRVFVVQPTAPYDIGDLWVQGASGDIMRSKVNKAAGVAYSVSDWEKAAKYTDDARAIEAESAAKAEAATLAAAAETAAATHAEAYADGVVTKEELERIKQDGEVLKNALLSDKVQDFGSAFKVFRNLTAFTGGNAIKGAIVIETGITFTSKMCRIDISGYNYRSGKNEIDLAVGFYAYNATTNFLNTGYTDKGTFKVPIVQLGNKNGKVCVILGDVNTVWDYPKLLIERAVISFSNAANEMGDGWTSHLKTSLAEYTNVTSLPKREMEDTDGAEKKVADAKKDVLEYTNVELKKTNDAVITKVTTTELRSLLATSMKIRYIRDWLDGSSANTSNHWVEIQAYASGENVAQEKLVGANGSVPAISTITNGDTDTLKYVSVTGRPSYVQIDLAEVRSDLEFLRVWHYSADGRTYNGTKTEVSSDGISWFTVFDSAVTGLYPETSEGNLIPLNSGQFFVNYQNRLSDVLARVSTAEEIIDKDSITNIVMQSESFQTELDGKAGSDLSAYATTEGVGDAIDESEKNQNDSLKKTIDELDLDNYTKFSELKQTTGSITANFKSASGVNLVRNSVGFAGLEYWESTGTMNVRQHSGLDNLGFGSGFFAEVGSGGSVKQRIYTRSLGMHSVSFMMDKTIDSATAGSAIVNVLNAAGAVIATGGLVAGAGITTGYQDFSFQFRSGSNELSVEIVIGNNASATITGLMVHIGATPLQWTMAQGEIYNTNVRMDMKGLRVSEIVDDKEKRFTLMTPEKFAGYYDVDGNGTIDTQDGSPDEVFSMNEDLFFMKNARVKEEFTIGSITMKRVESSANSGVAFIPSEQ